MLINKEKIADYLVRKDEWIFFGFILAASLAKTESNLWSEYLGNVVSFSLIFSPILVYKFLQPTLILRLNRQWQISTWISVFILYPLFMFVVDTLPNIFPESIRTGLSDFYNHNLELIVLFIITELVLVFSHKFTSTESLRLAIKKIGLDKFILFALMLFSIYFSLLATSNLELWISKNQLRHPIEFLIVLKNLPSFISLAIQIFLLYLTGFILYWVNRYILIEYVFAQRGIVIYGFSLLGAISLLYPILTELFLMLPINRMGEPIIPAEGANAFHPDNARVATAIMLVSLPLILFIEQAKKNIQLSELEKEKTRNELALLKQQINPHFFFNTLNNLYALCLKNSEKAPEVVLQLSELMRYVVYQGQQDSVLINDEINYIKDYISLQSIRLHKSLTQEVTIDLEDENTQIAPLLLIILVENAFKHGIEPASEKCFLNINLTVKEGTLTFICKNSIEEMTESEKQQVLNTSEGIGLDNLQRRLSLIYPERHELKIVEDSNVFNVKLTIDLTEVTVP